MKVLFLYTELADYFLKCCEKLAEFCEVHIVRWPVNKEAPFQFEYSDKIRIYEKSDYSLRELRELAINIDPDILVCSGWIDKDYLKVARYFFKRIPTVMTCDTHWRGDLRQRLAVMLSRLTLLRIFSHAWVPGLIQKKYALRLGFRTENIRLGFYSCDLEHFNGLYEQRKAQEAQRRFLFVGRYYTFKGVEDLWTAFSELSDEGELNGWELWCAGTGSVAPFEHSKIRHLGFVQPKDLGPLTGACSVFVLPSHYEPWGVVVQEYAAAGFPLILSNKVGAGEKFLETGNNGYSFDAGNVSQLKECLKKMAKMTAKQLISMSERSHALAQGLSPDSWSQTLIKLIHEGQKE